MENIIESNRDKKQLILNNFKFRIGSHNKELIRWRYITKNCTANIYTDENNTIITIQIRHSTTMINILAKHCKSM